MIQKDNERLRGIITRYDIAARKLDELLHPKKIPGKEIVNG